MSSSIEWIASDRIAAASPLRSSRFGVATRIEDVPPRDDVFEARERRELSETLESHLAPLGPHVAVLDSVRALRNPGATCVVTGQQPGLCVSPLYALYKALHAVRLARSLARAWERPVVPLFWNHADDHDVAEVHHTWALNENLDLQRIGLAGLASGRTPLSRIVFDEARHKLSAVRAALAQIHARWPHTDEALDLLLPRAGETFASAFTRSLTALLGHLGLVVLEPDWIRERASRALVHALSVPLAEALAQGEADLRAAHIEPAIPSATAALLFHVEDDGRRALRLGGEGFQYEGENGSRTAAELAAEILAEPKAWSPGALLRPIVQDACLPSVGYVGGTGEIGYLAQLGPLRRALGIPPVPVIPRWSCTLVDLETSDALTQLGESAAAVLSARKVGAAADVATPPAVVVELRHIAERAARDLAAQKSALAEIDAGLAHGLARAASQVRALIETTCEKAERVDSNRRGRGRRLVRRVENSLVPRGELQERVLGPLPFVARYGREWIDQLFEQRAAFELDHAVVRLGDAPAAPEKA